MKPLSIFKTAAALTLFTTLSFTVNATEKENAVEQYVNAVVSYHVADTRNELNNQSQSEVLNTAYRFELDQSDNDALVANVKVTFITEEQAFTTDENDAE